MHEKSQKRTKDVHRRQWDVVEGPWAHMPCWSTPCDIARCLAYHITIHVIAKVSPLRVITTLDPTSV
jgi:hypothetical protein